MILLHMALKKNHRQVMACLTLLGKMPCIGIANSIASRHGNHETFSKLTLDLSAAQGS